MEFLTRVADLYDGWITDRPTEAKVVTAVTFNVAADLVAQCIVKSKGKGSWMSWDTLPPLRLAFWGVLCTPLVDHWLAFLDSTFGDGSDYVTLGKKLCIDQLLFGPFLFSTFLIFVGAFDALTSKHKFAATFDGFFANVLQGHLAGMAFWLPVTITMFSVVPPKFRLLLLSVASLIYNIWLSLWVSGKAEKRGEKDKTRAVTAKKKSKKAD